MSPLLVAIQKERRIKFVFFIAALAGIFLCLILVQNLLVSFILAFVTYYLLAPAVGFLEGRGLSRQIATVVPFGIMTVALVLGVQFFSPILAEQFRTLQEQLPKYSTTFTDMFAQLEGSMQRLGKDFFPVDLKSQLGPQVTGWTASVFEKLPLYISQSLTVTLLTPLLAFFMLLDGRIFLRKLTALVPNSIFELFLNLQSQIGAQIGGFIRARILQSALVGLVIWVGLMILDFPYALVLALLAGILNIIPYLGPIIGALPAIVIHFANGGSGGDLFWLLFVYGMGQVIDTVLITPFVVAKIVNLHPVTVVLVILIGAQFMGILGMIICIPVFSALKLTTMAVYKHLTDFKA